MNRLAVLICMVLALSGVARAGDLDLVSEKLDQKLVAEVQLKGAAQTTDFTDIWYNSPAESEIGWGMQMVQNGLTIFATLFVFDVATQQTWFVAAITPQGAGFTGQLYSANGPYYGVPFNVPATGAVVGTLTFTPTSVISGLLSYDVNGVQVNKTVTRQTLANDNYTGNYLGVSNVTQTCTAGPSASGTFNGVSVAAALNQVGTTWTGQLATATGLCNFNGAYVQQGRFGSATGTFSCPATGETGTFNFFEMQVYVTGVVMRFTTTSNFCNAAGRLTATRQP
jgi:hypothetical protein